MWRLARVTSLASMSEARRLPSSPPSLDEKRTTPGRCKMGGSSLGAGGIRLSLSLGRR